MSIDDYITLADTVIRRNAEKHVNTTTLVTVLRQPPQQVPRQREANLQEPLHPHPTPFLRQVGATVRDLRYAKGWNEDQFAQACGLESSSVPDLEKGYYDIGIDTTLLRICAALEIKLAEFFKLLYGRA